MMYKIMILGDEKGYFKNLQTIFKNSKEFEIVTDKSVPCHLYFTVGAVDLSFTKEVVLFEPVVAHFGRVPPMIDPMFTTTQEAKHIYRAYAYQGTSDRDNVSLDVPYSYLPYPIDINKIYSTEGGDRTLQTKVIQGAGSISRYNKLIGYTALVCLENRVEFSGYVGEEHQQFLDTCACTAKLVVDQYFRGEMGCTCWEMLMLDIPVACYVRDETKAAMLNLFGSLPPVEYLQGTSTITPYATVADRERNIADDLAVKVRADYCRDGTRRQWMLDNMGFRSLEKYYGDFFRGVIENTLGGRS